MPVKKRKGGGEEEKNSQKKRKRLPFKREEWKSERGKEGNTTGTDSYWRKQGKTNRGKREKYWATLKETQGRKEESRNPWKKRNPGRTISIYSSGTRGYLERKEEHLD